MSIRVSKVPTSRLPLSRFIVGGALPLAILSVTAGCGENGAPQMENGLTTPSVATSTKAPAIDLANIDAKTFDTCGVLRRIKNLAEIMPRTRAGEVTVAKTTSNIRPDGTAYQADCTIYISGSSEMIFTVVSASNFAARTNPILKAKRVTYKGCKIGSSAVAIFGGVECGSGFYAQFNGPLDVPDNLKPEQQAKTISLAKAFKDAL